MNKFCLFTVLAIVLCGCGGVSREITAKSSSEQEGVFTEMKTGDAPARGMAALVITTDLKTHQEEFDILTFRRSLQGKPTYPFLLNIDGQSVLWQMIGREEKTADDGGKGTSRDDAGPGMRYALNKQIAIAPGPHTVFVALPGDNYSKEFVITLRKDDRALLDLVPVYQGRWHQNYNRGVRTLEISLKSGNPAESASVNGTGRDRD